MLYLYDFKGMTLHTTSANNEATETMDVKLAMPGP